MKRIWTPWSTGVFRPDDDVLMLLTKQKKEREENKGAADYQQVNTNTRTVLHLRLESTLTHRLLHKASSRCSRQVKVKEIVTSCRMQVVLRLQPVIPRMYCTQESPVDQTAQFQPQILGAKQEGSGYNCYILWYNPARIECTTYQSQGGYSPTRPLSWLIEFECGPFTISNTAIQTRKTNVRGSWKFSRGRAADWSFLLLAVADPDSCW